MVLFFGRKGNWIYILDVLQIFAIHILLQLDMAYRLCACWIYNQGFWDAVLLLLSFYLGSKTAIFVCCLSVLGELISNLRLLCMQVGSCWRSTISTCCSCGHSRGYHDSRSGKIRNNEQQCESMNEKF